MGIGNWDPRPGMGTGTGNLKIWGREHGLGQSLGDGKRAGEKIKSRDRDGDSKSRNGDWGHGRGLKN